MASIDVLTESNWDYVIASSVDSFYTLGGCDWTGSAWHSEGKVSFSTCTVDTGVRVVSIDFTISTYNAGFSPYMGSPIPLLEVKITGNQVVFSDYIAEQATVLLTPYDETTKHITSIVFKSYDDWTTYSYGNDGAGGDTGPCYMLDVSGLVFNLPDAPFVWQDYVYTTEIVTD